MTAGLALALACVAVTTAGAAALGWWRGSRQVRRAGDERARLLVELLGEAITIPDDVEAADDVVRRLGEALHADAAAVGLVSGNALRLFGMWGYGAHLRTSRLRPGEGISGQAWATGTPLLVEDVERMPHYVAGAPGIRSGAYVPGRLGGRAAAVLAVESSRPAAYGPEDLQLIQPVADLLTTLLSSRRLLRDAAETGDRLLPRVAQEVRPALAEAVGALERAGAATDAAERVPLVEEGIRSGRRLEHLLESVLLVARVAAGTDVPHPTVLPLSRVVATAVAASGLDGRVDVSVPAELRVIGDEATLAHALRELLADLPDEPRPVRGAVTARRLADEVSVELSVPHVSGLRSHVARRLVEAMGGRLEPAWPHGLVLVLPPAHDPQDAGRPGAGVRVRR